MGAAEAERLAVKVQCRVRIGVLGRNAQRRMRRLDRQPGLAAGEAVGRVTGVPRDRRALAIAALVFGPEADARRIGQFLEQDIGLWQPQFFALVDADRALEGDQHRHRLPRQHLLIERML